MFLIYVGLVVLICALEGTGRIFGFSLFPFSQTPFCSPDSDSTTALTTSFLPFAGFAVVDMLLLLFDCYLVWDVWPAFNPRSEFLLALIPDVVIICAYALNWHLDTHSLVDIKVTCFFMGSLAWPLTRTFNYVYTAPPELIERHCLYDIDGILSSVVTYDAFSNYLFQQKDDVGLELLSFYVQTALFQDLQDPTTEELNQAALSLYYEFLLPDKGGVSHFFPSSVVYDIGEVLRSNDASYVDSYSRFGLRQPPARIPVHPTLFDFAQQYVLEIFAKDYFPRFQLSQIYRDLVEQAKKAHKIHTKLKAQRLLTHTVADA
jgi:hypothetical protein